jgi:hypothetical protein
MAQAKWRASLLFNPLRLDSLLNINNFDGFTYVKDRSLFPGRDRFFPLFKGVEYIFIINNIGPNQIQPTIQYIFLDK